MNKRLKQVITVVLSSSMVLGCTMLPNTNMIQQQNVYAAEVESQNVNFPSEEVKKAVVDSLRTKLGRNAISYDSEVTTEQLSLLEHLYINYTTDYDKWEFLNYCTNLTKLTIQDNNPKKNNTISDLSNLKNLKKLKRLFINMREFHAGEWLNQLTELTYFHTDAYNFNLEYIKNLKNLQELSIFSFSIDHQELLGGLKALKKLTIANLKKINTSGFSSLENLQELRLHGMTNISNVGFLSHLNRLKKLELDNTSVSDISQIANMESLENLNIIDGNQIHDLSSLKNRPRSFINYAPKYRYEKTNQRIPVKVIGSTFSVPKIIEQDGTELPLKILDKYKDELIQLDNNTFKIKNKIDNKILSSERYYYGVLNGETEPIMEWTSKDGSFKDDYFEGKIHLDLSGFGFPKDANTQTDNDKVNVAVGDDTPINNSVSVGVNTEKSVEDKDTQTDNNKVDIAVGEDTPINNNVSVGVNTETNTENTATQTENNKVDIAVGDDKPINNNVSVGVNTETNTENTGTKTEKIPSDKSTQTDKNTIDKGTQTDLSGRDIDKLKSDASRDNSIISELEKLKDELTRMNEKAKLDIPKDIEIGQWYPDVMKRLPDKRSYIDGEDILLNGMQMIFSRYVLVGNKYEKQTEVVNFSDFRNEYRGWKFNLKTPKALLRDSEGGKMRVRFSFMLNNKNESMK